MKIQVLTILFIAFFSCKDVAERKPNELKSDKFELLIESDKTEKEKYLNNLSLTSLLENPIDLQKFKKSKNRDYMTTGVSNGKDYYFEPKIKDSIFYTYNYPTKNFSDSKKIDQIVVFKYGKNKHKYEDETEILIELRVFNKNFDLGKANLVGLTKTELESEFGENYLNFDNGIAYSNKNKVLILELENSKVKSYRYIKLNTEKIDNELIRNLIKPLYNKT
ncbi:hypothetical protein [Tenacibaculum sp. nBUS_03]|uniref:hypothetical protein n=1 Tax=Tenacibaculum sp. nBUS_03 TaxID=3395320 RepID=UPI003EBD8723